mgnify:CR=1 FL=1
MRIPPFGCDRPSSLLTFDTGHLKNGLMASMSLNRFPSSDFDLLKDAEGLEVPQG